MSNERDIVVRLRANTEKYPGFENLNTEAAATIELLRTEVNAWRTQDYNLLNANADQYVVRDGMMAMAAPMTKRVQEAMAATDAAGALGKEADDGKA